MRSRSRNRRLLGAILLVWSAAVALPRLSVICVAPGGHVAIEPGLGACIDRVEPEHAHPTPDAGTHAAGMAAVGACDDAPGAPCSDVPLDAQAFVRAALLAGAEPLLVLATDALGGDALAPEFVLSKANRTLVRHSADTPRLSSTEPTVLRC